MSNVGQRRLVVAHEARHYPRQGAVIVVSKLDAVHVRSRAPDARVVVVRNGVSAGPEPAPAAWSDSPPPVIAFHGVFKTRANADAARVLVEDVLPRVRRSHPTARVLLIGRDTGRRIQALAGPAVEVTGEVADVRVHLERAAVYVAPLVSGTGIKNKVLEAMAAGLPVVGTPLALEGIGAGPGTVEAAAPEDIAGAVTRLLATRGATRDAGRAARSRIVAEFSWERNTEELAALWADVLSPTGRH
jgi:glycosyltransferase involved in cell wall biosynthesis